MYPLVREYRRHILEIISLGRFRGMHAVYALHIEQSGEFLIAGLHPGVSDYDVSGLEIEPSDLAGCHIDIVLTRQIVLTPDETVAVRHDLQYPVGDYAGVQHLLFFGQRLGTVLSVLFSLRLFLLIGRLSAALGSVTLGLLLCCRIVLAALFVLLYQQVYELRLLHGRRALQPL